MEQIDILRHAVEALERMNVPYLVVGSFASIAYGESRFTQDIDIIGALQSNAGRANSAIWRSGNKS